MKTQRAFTSLHYQAKSHTTSPHNIKMPTISCYTEGCGQTCTIPPNKRLKRGWICEGSWDVLWDSIASMMQDWHQSARSLARAQDRDWSRSEHKV
jgi:hypothetical protein